MGEIGLERISPADLTERHVNHLLDAIEEGGSSSDWSIGDVMTHPRIQIWSVTADDVVIGSGVTEIEEYPARRVLAVHLYGGPLWALRALIPPVQQLAAHMGASAIRGAGRKGWARMLRARPVYTWEMTL